RRFLQRFAIQLPEQTIHPRHVSRLSVGVRYGEKRLAYLSWIWDRMTRQDVNFRAEARAGDIDDSHIDAVERSPAHDTCYSQLFSNSCCNSCRICNASTGRN